MIHKMTDGGFVGVVQSFNHWVSLSNRAKLQTKQLGRSVGLIKYFCCSLLAELIQIHLKVTHYLMFCKN